MAEGRSIVAWSHTSAVLTVLANANRDPKRPALKQSDFNPHAPRTPARSMPAERWWDMVVKQAGARKG